MLGIGTLANLCRSTAARDIIGDRSVHYQHFVAASHEMV